MEQFAKILKEMSFNIRYQDTVKWSKVENVGGEESIDGDAFPPLANDPKVGTTSAVQQVGEDTSLQVVVLVQAK